MVLWTYYTLLIAFSVIGLLLAVLGLPGIWLIVLATASYALIAGQMNLLFCVLVLLALGIAAEFLETALGGVAAKKAGASKRGILAAILGGLIGGLVATFAIPIPIVGTLLGALPAFLLAFTVELLWLKRSRDESLAIGIASAKGRFFGLLTKLLFGTAMFVTTAIWCWPTLQQPTTLSPTTLPQTNPATTPAP